MDTVSASETVNLELEDIQGGVLHPRPSPYVGTYLLLRIDDRRAGRELLRRLHPVVDAGRPPSDPARGAWVTVALTYQGLQALGVPQESLDSFAPEFRQGMAARAAELGDVGDSSPTNWESRLELPRSTWRWRPCRPTLRGWRRWSSGPAAPTRTCPGWR
jgi:deferrochelatase/peroxidase EfeB